MAFRRHKKKIIAGSVAVAIAAFFMMLPLMARPAMELAIQTNGFPEAHIGKISFLPRGLLIENISLDKNGFSAIDTVQITGEWRELLLKRQAQDVSIKNIELSGEIDNANRVTIAGWNGKFGTGDASGTLNLPFQNFRVDGITLDLGTSAGAIRTQGKAILTTANTGERIVTASLIAGQKQFSASINLNGKLLPDGTIEGKTDIEDMSIDVAPVTVSRMSGWVEFKSGAAGSYAGQVVAGGAKYGDTPFEDINLTFDSKADSLAVLKTKITGEPIVINGEWTQKPEKKIEFTIAGPSLAGLTAVQKREKPVNEDSLLEQLGGVEIRASANPDDLLKPVVPASAQILFQKNQTSIRTDLTYDKVAKKITGKIPPTAFEATDLKALLPMEEKFQLDPVAGKITVSGDYVADLSKTPMTVTGPVDIFLDTISGKFMDYEFTEFSGNLPLPALMPLQTAKDQKFRLKSLNAGKELTDSVLRLEGNDKEIRILTAQSKLAGGIVQLKPFSWYTDGRKNGFVVQLDKIKLSELSGDQSSFKADGSISGTLPITYDGKDIVINNGVLKSDQPGYFKYAPDKMPSALQGDDSRMETVRQALSDYHYDSLEITLNGPLNGNLKTGFTAKGSSPVFDNRAVNLNLNLEGALTAALKQALQPGQLSDKLQKSILKDAK